MTRQRGEFVESELAPHVTATVHPSSVLRMPDDESRRAAHNELVEDFRAVAAVLTGG